MADEKQDLRLSLQGSHFLPLPRELFLNIFNRFSLEGLSNLLFVNKFFLQVSYEAMLFARNAKDLLLGIFYTSKDKKPLTKKFLRDRIHLASPQKVDLSNAKLSQIRDYDSFPEKNIILKNVHDTEFYQTTLLNKILFKILAERHRCDDYECYSYNYVYTYIVNQGCEIYRKNGIAIDVEKGESIAIMIIKQIAKKHLKRL